MSEQDDNKQGNKTGDINAGILNIGGTQTFHGNVTVNYGNLQNMAESDPKRQELADLFKQLEEALRQVPAEQAEDVEIVKEEAEAVAAEAAKPNPSKKRLEIKGESLMKAAKNLLAVSPIAVQIAKVLLQIPV